MGIRPAGTAGVPESLGSGAWEKQKAKVAEAVMEDLAHPAFGFHTPDGIEEESLVESESVVPVPPTGVEDDLHRQKFFRRDAHYKFSPVRAWSAISGLVSTAAIALGFTGFNDSRKGRRMKWQSCPHHQ